ncbi:MAG: chemotaxis protein CheV [Betaproteobacteria bacterium]|nr:MAG: chemotaxis protein CheV [Betaproteobacteria bacterium]
MSELLKRVDARTCLAGTNKLEILLFTLGSAAESQRIETFGINVFKVREVMRAPPITRAPHMAAALAGMVSMRGALIPVIDLARYVGLRTQAEGTVLIVTEYSGHTQGFLVEAVDTILRLDWSVMKAPPAMLSSRADGLVTAVTELPDGRLVMMMDVERVLADTADATGTDLEYRSIRRLGVPGRTVLFADDSAIARRQIAATLKAMDVDHIDARNGGEAWSALEQLANRAGHEGRPLSDYIQAVLTDVEMPEMDGYMLTRKIKSDPRFAGLPVIMHSSLTGASNRHLGESVGVDEYVSKFEPQRLAAVLGGLLA